VAHLSVPRIAGSNKIGLTSAEKEVPVESGTAAIQSILEDLTSTEGILGSALIGFDGIVIADHFVVEVNLEKIGALLSGAYNSIQRIFGDLKQGNVEQTWFQTERFSFLLYAAPIGLILTVSRHDAPLGLIRLSMKRAVAQLNEKQLET
jgi:predicted regulator of Ras-like GTPase activity (Roadblock/LC7/MglB family)